MTDATPNPQSSHPGPLLKSFFSWAHSLAALDAGLTALLGGGAIVVALRRLHWEHPIWTGLLGGLVLVATFLALRPESLVTACLISARKRFLDGQITGLECEELRKKCLRKSLLY